uniref:Uncharacterized protein n=1 Tax=Arundo donax TaxID=35708 RepID=A0A0A9HZU9_ARUDO
MFHSCIITHCPSSYHSFDCTGIFLLQVCGIQSV